MKNWFTKSTKKQYLRKQKGEEDCLNKQKDFQSDLSSDKSRFEESSLNKDSINETDLKIDKKELGLDNKRKIIHKKDREIIIKKYN